MAGYIIDVEDRKRQRVAVDPRGGNYLGVSTSLRESYTPWNEKRSKGIYGVRRPRTMRDYIAPVVFLRTHTLDSRCMKTTVVVVTVLLAAFSGRAFAWNIPGHMLSAAIAHQILHEESPATIDTVKALLGQHPWHSTHWQTSLVPFAGADRDVLLFMLAARWADDIRMVDKAQHRGPWHYVNMPFKPAGQPAHIHVKPPGIPDVLTALADNRETAATDPDPQKKAIALSWLFHLVGDVHQPLHTSQLFSINYPQGDQGGNQICIRTKVGNQPTTLHSFWDDVITRSDRLPVLQKLATFLRTRQEFAKPALTELATTDFEGWAKESFEAAIAVAYRGGTLTGAPKNLKQDCREVAAAPTLTLDYIATARRVADRRMILAGYRLADSLIRVIGN
jgi:S1/P1 nuclease